MPATPADMDTFVARACATTETQPDGAHMRDTLSDDACSLPAYIHRYRMERKLQPPSRSGNYRKYNRLVSAYGSSESRAGSAS